MSVALSTAVAEVSVALRTGHMVAALSALDVDLQRKDKGESEVGGISPSNLGGLSDPAPSL